jgi:hypothetical protein
VQTFVQSVSSLRSFDHFSAEKIAEITCNPNITDAGVQNLLALCPQLQSVQLMELRNLTHFAFMPMHQAQCGRNIHNMNLANSHIGGESFDRSIETDTRKIWSLRLITFPVLARRSLRLVIRFL